nr:C551 [uncultured bacterium]
MPLAIACASHTPLMYRGPAKTETEQRVRSAFAEMARFVRDFNPEYVIQFAPDHFNGFFYDLMPPFCVGVGAHSLGDWGGKEGPLNVPESTALEIVDHLRADSFDVAMSYQMAVDHGFVQMWEATIGEFASIPIVPIFVNGAAPPLPTYRRARQLGESIGRYAMNSGKRVLIAASGGLSHDPPVPSINKAPPELRQRLINGRNPTSDVKEAREKRVLEAAVLADAGEGPCQPLNPNWDAKFLDVLRSGQIWRSDSFNTDSVREEAGRGANECLSWISAFGAFSMSGKFELTQDFYEAIPGWIAGMAIVAAVQGSFTA